MKYILLFSCCFFIFKLSGQIFSKKLSALSDGEIYKIGIKKDGVYKLTKKNLEDLGVNVNILNPKQIKILSNYGGSLPEAIAASYPDDLIEIPIIVAGEDDGKFNDNDIIQFYAEGHDRWTYNEAIKNYVFDKNIYSDINYVFLKISNENGKRLQASSILDNQVTFNTNVFTAYDILQEDKYNLLGQNIATHGSGKLWVGEYLTSNQDKDISSFFDFKDLDINQPIQYQLTVVGRTEKEAKFNFNLDGKLFSANVSPVSYNATEDTYARIVNIKGELKASNINPKITLRHNCNDAWVDYLQIISQKFINGDNGQIIIRNKEFEKNNYSTIEIKGLANSVLDVTDLSEIKQYGLKNGKVAFQSGVKQQKLILFGDNNLLVPELIGKVKNQNLHAIDNAELVIVYNELFKSTAEQLANHRKEVSKFIVSSVDVKEIYNEFSAGKLDPSAIRNFAKMVYDRNPNFKYLLLFGDGSYDYKGLVKNVPNQNLIPVYETDESLDPINAFPSDDYYALLSNNEGASLKGALDINVGRLTVNTIEEADAVVSKIIKYDIGNKRFGEWRLNSGFAADDEDGNRHFIDADQIAEESFKKDPILNQQKVFIDAYKQENTPGGERYPDATNALNQNIGKGQLTWSYLGHGGPKGLAQERVVKLSDIESWSNEETPTLFITATCSFAGFDDPSITSGGELALTNPKGGAIGLLTTVRSVYADENRRLTSNVYKNLYVKEKGLGMTFGEIIRSAKNATFADTSGDNTRKFTLLGDPSQRLAIPEHSIVVTKINGVDAEVFKDTVGALQKIVIQGEVRDYTSALVNDFSGDLSLTIFDKISTLTTLGNDSNSPKRPFDIYKNTIFKGQSTLENGIFTIECIVPLDIDYTIGKSRMSFYAHTKESDAAGYFDRLIIGGSKSAVEKDNTPPKMQLYMNDEKFVYGGITNQKPNLLIRLEDDFGINITGNSIGHDITAKLTGQDIEEDFVLNDYYKAAPNNFRKGEVLFPLTSLKPGLYKILVKAWDVSNNSVEGIIEFRVIDNNNQKLERVINYPNPFVNNTEFSFEHDLANTNLEIRVNIYTISGKLVKSIVDNQYSSGYRINNLKWEGKDDFGSNLAKGVYLYKIILHATNLNLRRESDFGKIVKI